MAGFNWVGDTVEVGANYAPDATVKVTRYSLEVAGYRVEVISGHYDEDCALGGWDAFKDGVHVDGGRGSCSGDVGFSCGDAERQVTEDALEAGEGFLVREVGVEALVEAGVYEAPPLFNLQRELEAEAERERYEDQFGN